MFGSSMSAHVVGDTITWIQYRIWLRYGDAGQDEDPNSPDAEDLKPMFDLNSTNTLLKYSNFKTKAGSRSNEWQNDADILNLRGRAKSTSPDSVTLYSGLHDANNLPTWADPATYAGMALQAKERKLRYALTEARLMWFLQHPCGITHVKVTGQKYQTDADAWPEKMHLRYSIDGEEWSEQWNEGVPSAPTGWEALSKNGLNEALGASYRHIQLRMRGAVPGGSAQKRALVEISAVEITLDSTNVPSISMGAEIISQYEIQKLKFENTTTGEAFYIRKLTIEQGQTIEINCPEKKMILQETGENLSGYLSFDGVPKDWMTLEGGAANTLKYTDIGTGAMTVVTKYYPRNN